MADTDTAMVTDTRANTDTAMADTTEETSSKKKKKTNKTWLSHLRQPFLLSENNVSAIRFQIPINTESKSC